MFNGKTTLHNEMYQSLVDNDSIGKYMIPTKLGHRVIFAETDSSNANPRSIFDLSDSNIAKKEALAACEFIARSVFE
jgi:chromosome partitioning protein